MFYIYFPTISLFELEIMNFVLNFGFVLNDIFHYMQTLFNDLIN